MADVAPPDRDGSPRPDGGSEGRPQDGPEVDPDGGVLPLFDHTHDVVTTGIVVGVAACLGAMAAWLAADFGIRLPAFLVGAIGSAHLLYDQPDRRGVLAASLYSLAAFVALVPVVYELGVVAVVDDPLRHVLGISDLLLLLVCWLFAAVPAIAGYRLSSDPFLPRLRNRRPRDGS